MLPNDEHNDLLYLLALTFVPGIGPKMGRGLLERYGSPRQIFNTSLKELKNAEGIGEVKVKAFKDPEPLRRAERELAYIAKHGIRVLHAGGEYPRRLTACSDAPLALYYKGNADLDTAKVVAIVGTRKNTDYGQQLCEELVDGLQALENVLVVSGLALGIDAVAHKRAVHLGLPTVGVLGHGQDKIYPYSHKGLAEQMIDNGGLLTEFPSDTEMDPGNFPMRNRIVAGMSDVTVVVESPASGGALITAHMASGYNREVAAFPGRVSDKKSAGCNELIRTNIAALINGADDLIEMMNWGTKGKPKAVQKQLFINFSPDEQKIVDALQEKDSVHSDELYHSTGLSSSQLASALLQLEMQGIVRSLPGKNYRLG